MENLVRDVKDTILSDFGTFCDFFKCVTTSLLPYHAY